MIEIKDNDISFIKKKECYLFFYFTAKWCGPCQRIKPLIQKLNEGLDDKVIEFYMVDIDDNDRIIFSIWSLLRSSVLSIISI